MDLLKDVELFLSPCIIILAGSFMNNRIVSDINNTIILYLKLLQLILDNAVFIYQKIK